MHPFAFTSALALLSGTESRAATGSATVVVIRGSATTDAGKALKESDKVSPGTTVKTAARSFVRLLFSDNTQLNIGPDTTMKLEATKAGEASLVDLVGGQLRAKVAKDPMGRDSSPGKEKMVIKTKTAAMGVRGTDFNVSFNLLNNFTALVTFEGNVAMARLEPGMPPFAALLASSGVHSVGAGQFSGAQPDLPQPTIPVKISPAQLETLKTNDSFKGLGDEKRAKQELMASPVPPGVDPRAFASGADNALKSAVSRMAGVEAVKEAVAQALEKTTAPAAQDAPPAEGFFNKATGEYAPRAGGFVDLSSGRYVPPPAGSSYDANTGTFVPPQAFGSVDPATGMYVPPKGAELDPVKGFVAEAARSPADGPTPPPPPDTLFTALNSAVAPESSTQAVTLSNDFSGGGGVVSGGTFDNNALPPPPQTDLPPPPPDGDPVPEHPVSENCVPPNCGAGDTGSTPALTNTDVNFSITVQ